MKTAERFLLELIEMNAIVRERYLTLCSLIPEIEDDGVRKDVQKLLEYVDSLSMQLDVSITEMQSFIRLRTLKEEKELEYSFLNDHQNLNRFIYLLLRLLAQIANLIGINQDD
ncbi:MAG: hypothetical protein KAR42_10595 [candidate division Zixibacteria bacterium]|nr:hypothetical protein [candidate division Zixibacteria bacterium]